MKTQPQITFLGMPPNEAAEALIRENVDKSGTIFGGILNCRVAVDVPRRQREGNQHEVRIARAVPGNDVAVSRTPDQQPAYQDVRQAIRETVGKG